MKKLLGIILGLSAGIAMSALPLVIFADGYPNLTASALTPTTSIGTVSTTFSSTITNSGDTETNAGFMTLFQKATDLSGTNATDIGTIAAGQLAASTSEAVPFSYAFPSTGTYYIRACANESYAGDPGTMTVADPSGECGPWTSINVTSALSASCSPSVTSVIQGGSQTWTAYPSGGTGSYTYSWNSNTGLSGTSAAVTETYQNTGTETASVTVTSGTQTETVYCPNSVTIYSGTATPPLITNTTPSTGILGNLINSLTGSGSAGSSCSTNAQCGSGFSCSGTGVCSVSGNTAAAPTSNVTNTTDVKSTANDNGAETVTVTAGPQATVTSIDTNGTIHYSDGFTVVNGMAFDTNGNPVPGVRYDSSGNRIAYQDEDGTWVDTDTSGPCNTDSGGDISGPATCNPGSASQVKVDANGNLIGYQTDGTWVESNDSGACSISSSGTVSGPATCNAGSAAVPTEIKYDATGDPIAYQDSDGSWVDTDTTGSCNTAPNGAVTGPSSCNATNAIGNNDTGDSSSCSSNAGSAAGPSCMNGVSGPANCSAASSAASNGGIGSQLIGAAINSLCNAVGGNGANTSAPAQGTQGTLPPPPTALLVATPTETVAGTPVSLIYSCVNSTSGSIDNNVGNITADGSSDIIQVFPSTNTTFTLTCNGSNGTTLTAQAAVVVSPTTSTIPIPPPTASLTASPISIVSGSSANLIYSCSNSSSGSIDNSVGTITANGTSNTTQVSPTADTTYMLTCTGSNGTTLTAQAAVVVSQQNTFNSTPTNNTNGLNTGNSTCGALSSGLTGNIGSAISQLAGGGQAGNLIGGLLNQSSIGQSINSFTQSLTSGNFSQAFSGLTNALNGSISNISSALGLGSASGVTAGLGSGNLLQGITKFSITPPGLNPSDLVSNIPGLGSVTGSVTGAASAVTGGAGVGVGPVPTMDAAAIAAINSFASKNNSNLTTSNKQTLKIQQDQDTQLQVTCVLNPMVRSASHQFSTQLTSTILSALTTGNGGGPYYQATYPDEQNFVSGSAANFWTSIIGSLVGNQAYTSGAQQYFTNLYTNDGTLNLTCPVTGGINAEACYQNESQCGSTESQQLNNYFIVQQYPGCTQEGTNRVIAATGFNYSTNRVAEQNLLNQQAGGYTPKITCILPQGYTGPSTGCQEWQVVTPAAGVQNSANLATNVGANQQARASQIGDLVSTLLSQVASQALTSLTGLSGLTQNTNGNSSYLNQLNNSATTNTSDVSSAESPVQSAIESSMGIEATYESILSGNITNLTNAEQAVQGTESCYLKLATSPSATLSSATSLFNANEASSTIGTVLTPQLAEENTLLNNSENTLVELNNLDNLVQAAQSVDDVDNVSNTYQSLASSGALHTTDDITAAQADSASSTPILATLTANAQTELSQCQMGQ